MLIVTAANRPSLLQLLCPDHNVQSAPPVLAELSGGITLSYGASSQIYARSAIFIAAHAAELPACFRGERCVAVIDSANKSLRTEISRQKLPALTCGRLGADSFTFSSWQNEQAVISLLRPLTAFDGSVVEPFELPVEFDVPPHPFDLLACAAVYSLLGEKSPLNKTEVWRLPTPHLR